MSLSVVASLFENGLSPKLKKKILHTIYNKEGFFRGLPLDENNPLCKYVNLWRACLDVALADFLDTDNKNHDELKTEVRAWLGTDAFVEVCNNAALDSTFVLTSFEKAE